MTRKAGAMAAAALGVASLGGCSFGADVSVASKAVDGFHQQLNAGQYDAIYAASAPAFKASTPAPQLDALLAAVHRKLGAFQSSKTTGFNVNANTSGTTATLAVTSTFAGGQAQENFAYQMANGHAALLDYRITSPALILR